MPQMRAICHLESGDSYDRMGRRDQTTGRRSPWRAGAAGASAVADAKMYFGDWHVIRGFRFLYPCRRGRVPSVVRRLELAAVAPTAHRRKCVNAAPPCICRHRRPRIVLRATSDLRSVFEAPLPAWRRSASLSRARTGALFVQQMVPPAAGRLAERAEGTLFAASARLDNREEMAAALQIPFLQLGNIGDDVLLRQAYESIRNSQPSGGPLGTRIQFAV